MRQMVKMSTSEDGSDDEMSAESVNQSPPSSAKKGTQRWRASEPPEEVFTETEQNQEWRYDIVGEEVDENGNIL